MENLNLWILLRYNIQSTDWMRLVINVNFLKFTNILLDNW